MRKQNEKKKYHKLIIIIKPTKFYVLVFVCFITNYLKLSGSKQHTSIISQFLWGCQESGHGLTGSTDQSLQICLEACQSGKRQSHSQAYLGCWKNLFPCGCMTEGANFLLGVAEGHPQVLEATTVPYQMDLSTGSSQRGHGIIKGYWKNLSLVTVLYNIT